MPSPPVSTPSPWKRPKVLVGAGIALIVAIGLTVGGLVLTGGDTPTPSSSGDPIGDPHPEDIGVKAAEAGCGELEKPRYQGRHQAEPGSTHPPYSSDPPTSGWYLQPGLSPGYYNQILPVEQAMTIAARGGVIVWVPSADGQPARVYARVQHISDMVIIEEAGRSDVVMVAWGVMLRCERFSGEALEEFVENQGKGKALNRVEPSPSPI